jgi:hypothetical protein
MGNKESQLKASKFNTANVIIMGEKIEKIIANQMGQIHNVFKELRNIAQLNWINQEKPITIYHSEEEIYGECGEKHIIEEKKNISSNNITIHKSHRTF